ncbi:DM13 domain-containing protein [Alteromonas gilva]|uniref:DM13 domain-containing protein n=1 Tax=Alteromonas gilva TaxID=2987522 RepID=A0ABT5L2S9_9ALTE|nr:DM13 domain-containing protein [Alteromonas gilva]MDC8831340.1 DM13 domain-containing protein [Alteromonas gilva]
MQIKKILLLAITHLSMLALGVIVGIYTLPILTAPPAPSDAEIARTAANAEYHGVFKRDLQGSDFLHWGEGKVAIGKSEITLQGKLAPGPDYKLYLSPQFVETEAEFDQLKADMLQIGDIKTFKNFRVKVAPGTRLTQYNTVVVWCESFGEFITSAKYR